MCGLIGVTGTSDAAREVFLGLLNLQHRGQDGAGILTLHDHQFELQKGSGLVENVFSERTFKTLRGQLALGHSRYATIGRNDPNMLQPFLSSGSEIGIGHNGNIVNVYALRQELLEKQVSPVTNSDSEIILHLLAEQLLDKEPGAETIFGAILHTMHKLVGSYAVVGIDGTGGLFGFRDPDGIRPLVMGKRTSGDGQIAYALASETCALSYLGYNSTEEIDPGEAVYINSKGEVSRRKLLFRSSSPCMFEWVYFARVESEIDSSPVYEARFQLGLLWQSTSKNLGLLPMWLYRCQKRAELQPLPLRNLCRFLLEKL